MRRTAAIQVLLGGLLLPKSISDAAARAKI